MCGIAGSFNRAEVFKLYTANLARGRYSAGMQVIYDPVKSGILSHTRKQQEPFTLSELPVDGYQFLIHSRAPTSKTTEFVVDETHPFEAEGVLVAHNGIITNVDNLRRVFSIDSKLPNYVNVDSYVIPWIIVRHKNKLDDNKAEWIKAILHMLANLRGTFGLWIHITQINTVFICRSGSTMYADFTMGSFTSSPTEGFDMLREGVLYEVSKNAGIFEVGKFPTEPIYYFAQ